MAFDSTPDDMPVADEPALDISQAPRPRRARWLVVATVLVLGLFVFLGPAGAMEQLQYGLADLFFDPSGGCGGP